MASDELCETCGERASVHVTEGAAHSAVAHHFCEKHGPSELAITAGNRERIAQLNREMVEIAEQGKHEYLARDMDPAKKEKAISALNEIIRICQKD
jgi:uncharacterized ferredoxin-like protein